jgi:pimeloyl-ACP methyl ester carboxylesterase
VQLKSVRPQYEGVFVNVHDVSMHYVHTGTGRPMLLIHGLVGSSVNWRNNIPALAQQASVYAIDLINMGKSQRVEGLDTSLEATANRIVAAMDSLQLADVDIVAHSHGGAVALMLAALHPGRVRRLILFAPANPYSISSDLLVRTYSTPWGGFLAWSLPYLPVQIQRIALGQNGGQGCILDESLKESVDCLRIPTTLRHVLSIIRCWFDEMTKLKAVLPLVAKLPTLLLWGDCDPTIDLTSGSILNRELPSSELVVFRGAGHSVFEELPEESNRVMLEWLGRDFPSSLPRDLAKAA